MHCPKSNPNFRDITGSEVENMVLYELFRLVSRFPLGQCARFGLVVTVAPPPLVQDPGWDDVIGRDAAALLSRGHLGTRGSGSARSLLQVHGRG